MNTDGTNESHQPTAQPLSARGKALRGVALVAGALTIGLLILMSLQHHGTGHAEHPEPPPWWGLGILPFIGILGSIAVLPLLPATRHWWESNLHRLAVSLGFSVATLAYFFAVGGLEAVPSVLERAVVVEYIPFIVLLFSLYVISGGISVEGDLAAHPATNTAILAFGALIASFIGTTGASMMLIRPLLQTNSQRKHSTHTVVFFIFLVSNIGGCLLPIGDPPLFLGYLYGVPFIWTLGLWPQWLLCCAVLLAIYFVWDTRAYKKEAPEDIWMDEAARRPLRLRGIINLLLLLGVVCSVAFVIPDQKILGYTAFPFMRELIMLGLVLLSLWLTPSGVRAYNRFNYGAILEVAALFIGIFITMQVAIQYLEARGDELGVDLPWKFFWATGILSSFLDNAPTYVVFFRTAGALPPGSDMLELTHGGAIEAALLVAISLGAVFMGAMTYIGNGPNFMVKSIAEQSGVRMPSFFGYMFRYSIPILIPVFLIVTFVFLR
ncbi:MAG: sodium:proton antiporter [Planctomycetota bacterium]|jgi:Na+/H+ antiporter NhaD/arsenite permease-like protein